MNIRNIQQIIVKELKTLFDHIGGYLLIVLLLVVLYFIFLQTFFLNNMASLRELFNFLIWPLSIFIPAVTMASIASEKDKHTIEYLLTRPISTAEILIGKIVGLSIFAFLPVLLTTPLAYFIYRIGPIDLGEAFAAYLGTLVLIISMSSIGVMISSFFKNQISSFIASAVVLFILNLIGSDFFAINFPTFLANIFSSLSLQENYFSLTRGAYDLKNIVYFVMLILFGYIISYSNLVKIRLSNISSIFKSTFNTIIILVAIFSIVIYASQYFKGRIDFTKTKKYTLSQVTRDVIKDDPKVKIDVYASTDLPPQFVQNYKELKNILGDYKFLSNGKLEVNYFDPKANSDALNKLGIQAIRFNIIGNDELQSKEGYLALVVSLEDGSKQEKIDFVSDVNTIEYELTSAINKIKLKDKPKVAFITGNDEKSLFDAFTTLNSVIEPYFSPNNIVIPHKPTPDELKQNKNKDKDNKKQIADLNLKDYKMVVILDPKKDYDEDAKKKLLDYYNDGGNILYTADTLDIAQQTLSASKAEAFRGTLFSSLGVSINQDLVYDVRSNLPVSMQSGSLSYMVNYPFFTRLVKGKDNSFANFPGVVIATWPHSLSLSDDSWKVLYSTSKFGSITNTNLSINPQQNFDTSKQTVVPIIAYKTNEKGGKIVAVSSPSILSNDTASKSQENALLALNLFEFMGSSKNLSEIKAKTLTDEKLNPSIEDFDKILVRFGAPFIALAILLIIGFSRIIRRKVLSARYS